MASVEKRGNSWRLVAFLGRDTLGKQEKRSMTIPSEGVSKYEAQKIANKFEDEELKNKTSINHNMTFAQFVSYWWDNFGDKQSPTTRDRNHHLLDDRIIPAIGHIKLRKLQPKHILDFLKNLAEPGMRKDKKNGTLSSRTIQMHYKIISSILGKAVKWKMLKENVCADVDTPQSESKMIAIYEEPDLMKFIQALLTKAKLKYQAFFLLGLTSGLRRSEILGLRWSDINFDKSFLRINQVAVREEKKGIAYKTAKKTKASSAPVPISPITLLVLKQLQVEQKILLDTSRQRQQKKNEQCRVEIPEKVDIIFSNDFGAAMQPTTFLHWLDSFTKKNGLPYISVHAFRHMAATYALDRGFDIKFVSNFIRHSNLSTTGDIYAHVLSPKNTQMSLVLDDIVKHALSLMQAKDFKKTS